MGWNYDTSLERVKNTWDSTQDIGEITTIVRATEFDNISLAKPRLVVGAHAYVEITNYRTLLGSEAPDAEMLRLHHLWAREVARVVEKDFDAVKIHFQGPKLHAVVYRPVGDHGKIASTAVLLAAAVRATTAQFIAAHGLEPAWTTAGGVDFGEAVATRSGVAGDRELLFLGDAANQAAKIIATSLLVTDNVAQIVADDVEAHLEATDTGAWRFTASAVEVEQLCESRSLAWTRVTSRDRIVADDAAVPDAKVHAATAAIDKDTLSLTNSKRVEAVSLFADADGFTAYVAAEQAADRLTDAVRAWHVIRHEMRSVLVTDYNGLRIQYAGDRIQGIVYLPIGDDAAVAVKAIKVAAAVTSAATAVLPQVIGPAAVPQAVGLAVGDTLVSKLGQYSDRDVVTLAPATAEAARIQQALAGGQIGIDATLRSRLPTWLADMFIWDPCARAYVVTELTLDEFERLEQQNRADAHGASPLAVLGITATAVTARRRSAEPQLKPYAP